jgi:hypothetical protein
MSDGPFRFFKPGHARYPGGGPYTTDGMHAHSALCGPAEVVPSTGFRYDTVPGSVMNPPQL